MFQRDEFNHFVFIPVVIGILGGFSAVLFRKCIDLFQLLADKIDFGHNTAFFFIAIPPIFVVSNFLVHKFLREHPAITLDGIAKKIALHGGEFSPLRGFFVLTLTSLNIGFGLPVGREAPIAKLGGLFGELFLKWLKVNKLDLPLYLAAAVSSAIAATFNAPLAGIILGLEIIIGRVNLYILIPLIVSSTTATLVAREFLGNFTAFYVPHLPFKEIYFYLVPVEGLLFAIISLFVIYSFDFLRTVRVTFRKYWYPLVFINGLIVAFLLAFFPEIRGVGYDRITELFHFHYNFLKALEITVLKLWAVILTIGSGLFGGLMSPSIFIGAFGGYTFGEVFTHWGVDPRVLALAGSVAMLAGISRAPLRTTVIIIELTHAYQLLLPTLIAASVSSFLVAKFEPGSYFRRSLIQKGIDIDDPEVLEFLKTADFRKYLVRIPPVSENTPISKALKIFAKVHIRYLPVVNRERKLVGILSVRDLIKLLRELHDVPVREIMSKSPVVLHEGASVKDILRVLGLVGTQYVPYVDLNHRYLGMVDIHKLFKDLSLVKHVKRV